MLHSKFHRPGSYSSSEARTRKKDILPPGFQESFEDGSEPHPRFNEPGWPNMEMRAISPLNSFDQAVSVPSSYDPDNLKANDVIVIPGKGSVKISAYEFSWAGETLPGGKNVLIYGPYIDLLFEPEGEPMHVNWVQTVNTNFNKDNIADDAPPLEPITFADPKTEENEPHTYYEPEKYGSEDGSYNFWDNPRRPRASTGDVYWQAELSLIAYGENGFESIITFAYGFHIPAEGEAYGEKLRVVEAASSYHGEVIKGLPEPKE